MKDFFELREAVSAAQQAAIAISKKEKGEKPKDVKEYGGPKISRAAYLRKGKEYHQQNEAKAQLYHNSFSAAVQHAIKQAQKKGYEVDEEDWQRKVASGPSKPSAGKTNRYAVNLMKNGKPVKQKLHMQVYGMDSGKYELNMYVS